MKRRYDKNTNSKVCQYDVYPKQIHDHKLIV